MNTIVSLSKLIIILGIRIQLTDSYISWIYSPQNDNKNTLAGTLLAINFQALIPAIFKDTKMVKTTLFHHLILCLSAPMC